MTESEDNGPLACSSPITGGAGQEGKRPTGAPRAPFSFLHHPPAPRHNRSCSSRRRPRRPSCGRSGISSKGSGLTDPRRLDLAEWRDKLVATKLDELGADGALRVGDREGQPWAKAPSSRGAICAPRPRRRCGDGGRASRAGDRPALRPGAEDRGDRRRHRQGGDPSPWESCAAVAETPSGVSTTSTARRRCARQRRCSPRTSTPAGGRPHRGALGLGDARAAVGPVAWRRGSGAPSPRPRRLSRPGAPRGPSGGAGAPWGDSLADDLDALTVAPSREDRSFAAAVAEPALDGERHRKAAAIVGLLARHRPSPRRAGSGARARLRRGPRRRASRSRSSVRSSGHGAAPSRPRPVAVTSRSGADRVERDPRRAGMASLEGRRDGGGALAHGRLARGGARDAATEDTDSVLDRLIPTRATTYTRSHFARDRRRGLLPIDALPRGQTTGELDLTVPTGHGWGEVLNTTLGGGSRRNTSASSEPSRRRAARRRSPSNSSLGSLSAPRPSSRACFWSARRALLRRRNVAGLGG